ncbi:MAG: hypothetical protein GC190_16535 [Alphaproteobacteria bacterium]|nr:hypothetical protein [Alphaproteobacteria bacterium]
MSLADLAAIGSFVSGIAVVGSLIFVGLQLLQSNRMQRSASLQSLFDGLRERTLGYGFIYSEFGSIFAQGMASPSSLSEEQRRRFFFIVGEQLYGAQQAMMLKELKLIPDAYYESWVGHAASLVKTPGGAEMWKYYQNVVAAPFRNHLNAYLSDNPGLRSFLEVVPLFDPTKAAQGSVHPKD